MTKYQLQEVAQAEHVNTAGDLTKLSRGELCDKIVEHRVASTHKVGVTRALSVVVDDQHPLIIGVEPHCLLSGPYTDKNQISGEGIVL